MSDGKLGFFLLVQHIRICDVGEKGFDENRIKILANEVCVCLEPPKVGNKKEKKVGWIDEKI